MTRSHAKLTTVAAALSIGCATSDLSDQERDALVAALASHGRPPVDYVVSAFSGHDVVILGEHQLVAQDVSFIVELIPHLHAAGVNVLAIEYATAADQLAIDSLVTNIQYDPTRAVEMQRRYAGGTWPYREYLDIYREAWDTNRKRAPGREPFRIVGIHPAIDWETINYGDEGAASLQRRLVEGTDAFMAAAVRRLSTEVGEKALVYCGMRHAFTNYRSPVVGDGDGEVLRRARGMGNILDEVLGDRVMTIALHSPWPGIAPGTLVSPCGGAVDLAVAAHGDSVGFDVAGTPFADLRERRSVFVARVENGVALGALVDGYVAHAPIAELDGVTVMSGWIAGEQDLARAKRRFPDRRQAERLQTVRDVLDAFQRDAALPPRFARSR